MKHLLPILALITVLAAQAQGRPEEIVIDTMVTADQWAITGQRVCYTLGQTAVGTAKEPAQPGTTGSVRFSYDLGRRAWVGLQWQGGPLPGSIKALSFRLYGDGSKHRLAARFEDARQRSFEASLGVIDWEGWRQVSVPMEKAKCHGEEALPVCPSMAVI